MCVPRSFCSFLLLLLLLLAHLYTCFPGSSGATKTLVEGGKTLLNPLFILHLVSILIRVNVYKVMEIEGG